MCLKSDHAIVPPSLVATPGSAPATVTPVSVKKSPDDFMLIDVREADELASGNVKTVPGATNIPLGSLLRQAADGGFSVNQGKRLVCVCNVGFRSSIAASTLTSLGYTAFSLLGGAEGYNGPIASWYNPDYVVVLQSIDPEKATLALSVATAAQSNGQSTALICMGPSPLLFRQKGEKGDVKAERAEEMKVGEPFQEGAKLIQKFTESGGFIFGCKSCVKFHKLDYSKLEDYVQPMQAPDLVRMTTQGKGSTTFA